MLNEIIIKSLPEQLSLANIYKQQRKIKKLMKGRSERQRVKDKIQLELLNNNNTI